MAAPRVLSRPHGLTLAILLALGCLAAAVYALAPHVQRWRMLGALTAAREADRDIAIEFVEREAPTDPRVLSGALAVLPRSDDAGFLRIVRALDRTGLWSPEHVPAASWLRWLGLLAGESDETTQVFAAQRLGELKVLADMSETPAALLSLVRDDSPRVRYHALINTASLAGVATNATPYVDILRLATRDAQPQVARHAWIALGLLDVWPLPELTWRDAEPEVAEAMLWAALQTSSTLTERVIAVAADAQADPRARASAVYALHFSAAPEAQIALLDAADVDATLIDDRNQLIVWRAILGLPKPNLNQKQLTRLEEVVAAPAWDEGSDPLVEPLALASVYRMGIAGSRRAAADWAAYDDLRKLATVEGQEPPYMYWPLTGDKPPILRVMTVAVARDPRIGDLRPAFRSRSATTRDLACVVAVEKFDGEALRGMIESLLTDSPSPEARMSGALLAGLSGQHPELPMDALAMEPDPVARRVLPLSAWIAGDARVSDADAEALLGDPMTPPTTAMLALLHKGRRIDALDQLFSPNGEPRLDLVQTLGPERWWHVLKHYLPSGEGAPPFWVWGDRQLQAFQVDVLRDWYLVHRHQWANPASREATVADTR